MFIALRMAMRMAAPTMLMIQLPIEPTDAIPIARASQCPSAPPTIPTTMLAMMPICALVFMRMLASQPTTPPMMRPMMRSMVPPSGVMVMIAALVMGAEEIEAEIAARVVPDRVDVVGRCQAAQQATASEVAHGLGHHALKLLDREAQDACGDDEPDHHRDRPRSAASPSRRATGTSRTLPPRAARRGRT